MAEILIAAPMEARAVAMLEAGFVIEHLPKLATTPEQIAGHLGQARALIVAAGTPVTPALLEAARGLRCIGCLGETDAIDRAACARHRIDVIGTEGAQAGSVAEYVLTTAMVLLRGAYRSKHAMLNGRWPQRLLTGREMAGTTLGLVGFGPVAQAVAARGRAMGCRVVACDPDLAADHPAWSAAERLSLDGLLRGADVVSLHVPRGSESYHLIDAEALAAMPAHAVLINAGSGGAVDEEALAEALHAGRLAGAALDTFETEPLSRADAAKFKGLDDLILTPRIAGLTEQSLERLSEVVADRVRAWLTR